MICQPMGQLEVVHSQDGSSCPELDIGKAFLRPVPAYAVLWDLHFPWLGLGPAFVVWAAAVL